MSLREKLQAGAACRYLEVSAFGVPAALRTVTINEHASWGKRAAGANSGESAARFVVLCLVDPVSHEPLLSDADIPLLVEQQGGELLRVFNLALAQNGLRKEDQEALVKN